MASWQRHARPGGREGARASDVVRVRVREHEGAHGLAPGRLGDRLQDLGADRGVRSGVHRDDAVAEEKPADVGALLGLPGPHAVGELVDLELGLGPRRRRERAARARATRTRVLMRVHSFDGTTGYGIGIRDTGYETPDDTRRRPRIPSSARPRRRPRALGRNSAKRRRETGSSARFSGCHCTATNQALPRRAPTASATPSGATAETARPGATRLDRLVVAAVDRDLRGAGDRRQARPGAIATWWSQPRLVLRAALVDHGRRALARDVLHERAAESDVDDLEAAADRRAPGVPDARRLLEEAKVERVALGIDLDGAVAERGPARSGRDRRPRRRRARARRTVRAAGPSGVTTSIASRGTPASTSDRTIVVRLRQVARRGRASARCASGISARRGRPCPSRRRRRASRCRAGRRGASSRGGASSRCGRRSRRSGGRARSRRR